LRELRRNLHFPKVLSLDAPFFAGILLEVQERGVKTPQDEMDFRKVLS
jgi:hypothetical protein